MFSVKATYNNETRKFTLPESTFPAFESIQSQLYRVFPIRGSYYLSKLMFCPSEGTRVVVGREVHNAAEYLDHITPFCGRLWPNGLLRFTVVDEIPHKLPAGLAPPMEPEMYEPPPAPRVARPLPRFPPTLLANMDIDTDWTATAASNRDSMVSQSTQSTMQSCCSVTEGKEEMKDLMSGFLRDFNRTMSATFGEVPESSNSSSETVIPEQKTADDASDVTIPGAFVQQPAKVQAPIEPLHPGITCDYCHREVRGTRFKCQNCDDFDLCERCYSEGTNKHLLEHAKKDELALHSFLSVLNPGDPISEEPESPLLIPRLVLPKTVHNGVVCDFCGDTVIGNRYKCLDCSNFDLCEECYPRGKIEHHMRHEFVTLKTPGRVLIHRVRDGDETPRFAQPNLPTTMQNNARPPVHNANCDLCDSRIHGTRFKCLSCPDFDLCSSCRLIASDHHPKHSFVMVETPQDLTSRDASSYRRHGARCDECGHTIRGIRYKCLHPECPDYDLCAKCEALPIEVHPAIHPLVKLRCPETVIPTVYRVGGTSLITPYTSLPQTTGVAVATDPTPSPEKADVAVHAEIKPTTSDASVATVAPAIDEYQVTENSIELPAAPVIEEPQATEQSVEQSVELPLLPTPPPFAPGTALETVQQFANFWKDEPSGSGEANDEIQKEMLQTTADIPSLFSAFMENRPLPNEISLRATFISDVNIEDGQMFPPGAEFVKCWHIRNDGESAWPETTRVTFVAGDRMPAFDGAPLSYYVGPVKPGETVDVNAYDMKAPENPGKYVGYWRLSDGTKPFGQSVWCDISVLSTSPQSEYASLTASSVIMPEPSHTRAASVDHPSQALTPELMPSTSVPATPTVSAPSTEVDSADSLLDSFDSDEEFWEASRGQVRAQPLARADSDFVVLYDEQSTDDEGH